MNEIIEHFKVVLDFDVVVNTDTGEITTKCTKKTIDKSKFEVIDSPKKVSKPQSESDTPQLILEDNKYILNKAAIALMRVAPDDKLDIKYEKKDKSMIPVIGSDEVFGSHSGNRLTKSNTVAYRGAKNEELAKYGHVFDIVPHDSKEGLFFLVNEAVKEDKKEEIEELDESLPLEADLTELIDNAEEIDSLDFTF